MKPCLGPTLKVKSAGKLLILKQGGLLELPPTQRDQKIVLAGLHDAYVRIIKSQHYVHLNKLSREAAYSVTARQGFHLLQVPLETRLPEGTICMRVL